MSRIEKYDLPTGARYLRIPHHADPDKGSEWLLGVQKEMADTPTIFRREILMDETVREGIAVYPGYDDAFHCPQEFQTKKIPLIEGSILYAGWDCGSTVQPAFTLLQLTPKYLQVHFLMEVISYGGEGMGQFVPRVYMEVEQQYPGVLKRARHECDPSARSRSGTDRKSAIEVAREKGLTLRPALSNAWLPRHSAVSDLLAGRIDTFPRFIICGFLCPVARAGFQGDYKLKVSSSGDKQGPGVILSEPVKNLFSHVHDGLQYPAMKINDDLARLSKEQQKADKSLSRSRRQS